MTPRPAMTAWVEWECGFGFDQVEGDASDAGARDREGEESEGGALGREARAEAEDWVLLNLLRSHSGHYGLLSIMVSEY
jgi:hypothetical protein